MAYTTKEAVREVLRKDDISSGSSGTAADLPDSKIDQAIVDAASEVDGRLGFRFNVPFADDAVPSLVQQVTRDIAAYLATLTYQQSVDFDSDLDPVLQRYERAKTSLSGLADGSMSLGASDPATSVDDPSGLVHNPYSGYLLTTQDVELFRRRPFPWVERIT